MNRIGAEAVLTKVGSVMEKRRVIKSYRNPTLDRKLRYERMHREANILEKLQKLNVPVPKLLDRDEENAVLRMEYIDGKLLRDVLECNWQRYAAEIGKRIAQLHTANIIHGDLTTSNMMVRGVGKKELVLIDFGLSYISHKVEDRAVDLHLLRQALDSKHHSISEKCYAAILRAYQKQYRDARAVLKRLEQVEQRGRYKGKG